MRVVFCRGKCLCLLLVFHDVLIVTKLSVTGAVLKNGLFVLLW